MQRPPVYSRTPLRQNRAVSAQETLPEVAPGGGETVVAAAPSVGGERRSWHSRLATAFGRAAAHPGVVWTGMALVAASVALAWWWGMQALPKPLTQKDIDAAVLRSVSTHVLPSAAARAAEKIRPSVVRVMAFAKDKEGQEVEQGVGTGVVIVDKGVVLTNLHVVQSAQSLKLTFADGSESGAKVTGVQADQDLAVLQALSVPDDLVAATLSSTQDLRAGDEVVAVGFPFGVGPSVSAGVVSGLGRSFRSPEGKRDIQNLIQFDAAANPGNSGGPLVTLSGEVVGVVTGIMNPTNHRTFVGIAFAVPIESAAGAAGMPPF